LVALIAVNFYSEVNSIDVGYSSLKITKVLRVVILACSVLAGGANADVVVIDSPLMASFAMSDGPCPADFFQLPLHPQARLCRVFADELPASLTYHVDTDQQSASAFYQQQLGQAQSIRSLKGRTILQYKGKQQTIIISDDGKGSQIDILVKSRD
jgi:hypothetical protein